MNFDTKHLFKLLVVVPLVLSTNLCRAEIREEIKELQSQAIILLDTNLVEAREIAENSYFLAKDHRLTEETAKSLYILGYCDDELANFDLAVKEYFEALRLYKLSNKRESKRIISEILLNIGRIHRLHSNHKKAIHYYEEGLKIASQSGLRTEKIKILQNLSIAHKHDGNLNKAVELQLKKLSILTKDETHQLVKTYNQLGLIHIESKELAMARKYFRLALDLPGGDAKKDKLPKCIHNIGYTYLLEEVYDSAEFYFLKALQSKRVLGDNSIYVTLLDLTQLYLDTNQIEEALKYGYSAEEALGNKTALTENFKIFRLLFKIHSIRNEPQKAEEYFEKYTSSMEAIYDKQNKLISEGDRYKINDIATKYYSELNKKDKINWDIISYIMMGILIVIVSYQLIKKKQQSITEARNRVLNLELTALRSQINPHFLFNAINSIKKFILQNDTVTADLYLSDFSRLMRYTLEHSDKMTITIQEEIENLEMYVKIEQLRTEFKFDYEIEVDAEIDPFNTYVPAMVLQPFVENAIWHGLVPAEIQGKLKISFRKEGNQIRLLVRDDGIGISADNAKSDHNSMGMRLISERITLLKKYFKQAFELKIETTPMIEQGTLVSILVPDNLY